MATGKVTQDHEEIRRWAEARGGKPGAVRSTETEDDPGILRICFPNAPHKNNEAIEEIEWDDFFDKFDEQGLEFHYQEKTAGGQTSDFNKLTYPDPDSAAGKRLLAKSAKKSSAKKSAAKKSASKSASAKSPAKTAAKNTSGTKSAAKKSAEKKSAQKTPETKSAGKKSEPPVRNFPKPEHGHGHSQVF